MRAALRKLPHKGDIGKPGRISQVNTCLAFLADMWLLNFGCYEVGIKDKSHTARQEKRTDKQGNTDGNSRSPTWHIENK